MCELVNTLHLVHATILLYKTTDIKNEPRRTLLQFSGWVLWATEYHACMRTSAWKDKIREIREESRLGKPVARLSKQQ